MDDMPSSPGAGSMDLDSDNEVPISQEQFEDDSQEQSRRLRLVSSDNEDVPSDEGVEGDDLDEHVSDDYRAIPELDRYDSEILDSSSYGQLDPQDRDAAEREMAQRDRDRMGISTDSNILPARFREPAAMRRMQGSAEDELLSGFEQSDQLPHSERSGDNLVSNMNPYSTQPLRRDHRYAEDDEDGMPVNIDDYQGPIREWIHLDAPRREIRRRFRAILTEYADERGQPLYSPRIQTMCAENQQSLLVEYAHLSTVAPTLGIWLAECPKEMLALFDEEAYEVVLGMFPEYVRVHDRIHVRIVELPISDKLRDLRQMHLNALIRVSGVVTRRTAVFPQLVEVKFNCAKCGLLLGPYPVGEGTGLEEDFKPSSCPQCDSPGPFPVNSRETLYRNYQRITLQESPGTVPAGRIPRTKEVILTADLRDCASPGEEVEVTGTYVNAYSASLNTQHGFPVFSTRIEANYVCKRKDEFATFSLTDEDVKQIRILGERPDAGRLVVKSIAPSIYGHEDIKTAVALTMLGGVAKHSPNSHRIRGDINLLLLGDPGTAKSQFLKYIEKTAHRAVFTTGKGASAVGLTASVRRDQLTREWTLEGGALVLADQGVCLIDEFDKMNDQDRTSIHEAMEQQSISISKAGIITTLQARCSVVAAANPIKGRYDSSLTFVENVDLTDPILSRFDILCVVRDVVDPVIDEQLAEYVINSHIHSRPVNGDGDMMELPNPGQADGEINGGRILDDKGMIPQSLLKKYILYARRNVHPQLDNIDQEKIAALYTELRRLSAGSGGVPIAVRHIESMLRMAEAHAKMHLREVVSQEDVDAAIRVMLHSFIGAQKYAVMRKLEKHFRRYMQGEQNDEQILFFKLKELVNRNLRTQQARHAEGTDGARSELHAADEPLSIRISDLEQCAREVGIADLGPFFNSEIFSRHHFHINGDSIVHSFD